MTEASQRTCPVHGEDDWIDTVADDIADTAARLFDVLSEPGNFYPRA